MPDSGLLAPARMLVAVRAMVPVTLMPPNSAEAYYNLATGQLAAGKTAEAKRSILRSLEAAPGFEKAQDLLLRLTRP